MDYFVYTDGACKNNGKANACAGLGVYFGENDLRNCSKLVVGKQTNNVAELSAVVEAYYLIKSDLENGKKICIVTDSNYVLKCVGSYGEKCESAGWKKKHPIPNVELLKKAYLLYKNSGVKFMHINAHTGHQDIHSLGNEQADKLAVLAIDSKLNKTNSKISIFNARIYLNVPYAKKEHAKSLGAKWDPKNKKWYSMKLNNNLNELVKYY
jgi:ribonuclease HI